MNAVSMPNSSTATAKALVEAEILKINDSVNAAVANVEKIKKEIQSNWSNVDNENRERDHKKLLKELADEQKTVNRLNKLLEQAFKDERAIDQLGGIPKTPTKLVEDYIARYGIKIHLNNYLEACRDSTIESTEMVRVSIQLLNANLKLGFGERAINYAFSKYLNDNGVARRERIKEAVRFDGDLRTEVWGTLVATCFKTDDPVDYVIAVLQKFVWQIKRKMDRMIVTDHIMPIIVGAQGTGKTEFIERLIGPINENVSFPNLREVTDSRNRSIWKRWALVIDEMEGAERTDVDALKNVITKKVVSGRVMFSGDDFNDRNEACLVGNSNRSLDELIKDSTGLRRFVQLNWADIGEAEWAVINATDFAGLWRSIDPAADDPLKPFKDYTRARQEEYRQKSIIEQWVTDTERDYKIPEHEQWLGWKGSSRLYNENFLPWYRRIYGSGAFTQTRFGRDMKKITGTLVAFQMTKENNQYRLLPRVRPSEPKLVPSPDAVPTPDPEPTLDPVPMSEPQSDQATLTTTAALTKNSLADSSELYRKQMELLLNAEVI